MQFFLANLYSERLAGLPDHASPTADGAAPLARDTSLGDNLPVALAAQAPRP